MKIVIINGSARKGNTLTAINAFIKGASEKNEIEIIEPDKLNIAPCKGCGVCQCSKGCVDKDDTNPTIDKIAAADMILFATPVYWWGMSAQLKLIIDKCYCRGLQLKNKKALAFIENLLDLEMVNDLELFDDQGVKVSTHTYDVLMISIDELKRDYRSFTEAKQRVDFFAMTIGIIIHDLSKGSIRKTEEKFSHSQMMLKKPEYITKEADRVLKEIEEKLDVEINDAIRKNIIHIVLSHHGKWGKIQPNSKEAHIVHRADMYSAKYHRINPIGADKILELMAQGMQLEEISIKLNCTQGVIKDRLKRAKQELNFKNTKQLINYYKKNKKIPIGDNFFIQRVRETEKLKRMVDRKGFKNIMLENPLIPYFRDDEIFKKKELEKTEPNGKK